MENGRIVLDADAERLRTNEDVQEFYLGLTEWANARATATSNTIAGQALAIVIIRPSFPHAGSVQESGAGHVPRAVSLTNSAGHWHISAAIFCAAEQMMVGGSLLLAVFAKYL